MIKVVEGNTSNDVSPLRSRKSIGKEHTFSQDTTDVELILKRLDMLIDGVFERMKRMQICARLVEVKIRYKGFETHTVHRSIPVAMDEISVFRRLAHRLFAENCEQQRPVRLVGFRVGQLDMQASKQTILFNEEE